MSDNPEREKIMNNEIQTLLETIKADYLNWWSVAKRESEIPMDMINRFNESISIEEGRSYIKIITDRSVWGFVVKKDTAKFRKGDILKAASWKAPATNAARGNILDGGYSVAWTGPHYLV